MQRICNEVRRMRSEAGVQMEGRRVEAKGEVEPQMEMEVMERKHGRLG